MIHHLAPRVKRLFHAQKHRAELPVRIGMTDSVPRGADPVITYPANG